MKVHMLMHWKKAGRGGTSVGHAESQDSDLEGADVGHTSLPPDYREARFSWTVLGHGDPVPVYDAPLCRLLLGLRYGPTDLEFPKW